MIGWTPSATTANRISYSPTTLDGLHRLKQQITPAIHQQNYNIGWTPSPTTPNHISYSPTTLMDSIAYNTQSHQLFTNNIGLAPSATTANHISYSPTRLGGLHQLQQPITSAVHQQHWMDSIAYNNQSHQLFTNIGWTPSPTTANHISYSPTTLNGLHLLQQPITSAAIH